MPSAVSCLTFVPLLLFLYRSLHIIPLPLLGVDATTLRLPPVEILVVDRVGCPADTRLCTGSSGWLGLLKTQDQVRGSGRWRMAGGRLLLGHGGCWRRVSCLAVHAWKSLESAFEIFGFLKIHTDFKFPPSNRGTIPLTHTLELVVHMKLLYTPLRTITPIIIGIIIEINMLQPFKSPHSLPSNKGTRPCLATTPTTTVLLVDGEAEDVADVSRQLVLHSCQLVVDGLCSA